MLTPMLLGCGVQVQTIKTSVESATMLLRIDDIVSGITKKDKVSGPTSRGPQVDDHDNVRPAPRVCGHLGWWMAAAALLSHSSHARLITSASIIMSAIAIDGLWHVFACMSLLCAPAPLLHCLLWQASVPCRVMLFGRAVIDLVTGGNTPVKERGRLVVVMILTIYASCY
jgi:hypothetical protein